MSAFAFSRKPVQRPPVSTPWRTVRTALPVPESLPILENLARYESRSMHGQMPVVWDSAEGVQVRDKWGNVWLDFTSTIFVANAGHANPRVRDAIIGMAEHGLLHTYSYASEVRATYLRALVEATPEPFSKAYLMSTGTEATEMVMKLMRLHGLKTGKRAGGIVTFEGAYHGRTQGAAMVSGTPAARGWIGFKDPHAHQVPFPYEWDLTDGDTGEALFERHIAMLREKGVDPDQDLCGFLFEAYIGWAAALIPAGYARAAEAFARRHGILLGFDEVQGGFGRTGALFTYQHYGVRPDLIACGKGISSSLPLSAVLGAAEVMDLPEVGSMSSTHSANPLSCAAALANLKDIQEHDLVGQAERSGAILFQRLESLRARYPDRIARVSGKGMLAALIFRDPRSGGPDALTASRICERCMHKGVLLVHTGRESIKFGPPLVMPEAALHDGMDALDEAVAEILDEQGA